MIFGMTYYEIAMYFLIYSFAGWCLEVVFHALKVGKIINRGFLNGPVCPVYGFGMLAVCAMIHFLPQDQRTGEYNGFAVFLGGMILATVIEFVAGYLLYHLFHARWWDYSHLPLNIGGYICPLYSILWGLGCVLVVRYVHPLVQHSAARLIPEKYGWPILGVLYLLYLADFIVTVLTVTGMNKELDELDRIRAAMRKPSDRMSELIGGTTLEAAKKAGEAQVQAALGAAELRDSAEKAKLEAGERILNTRERAEEQRSSMRVRYDEAKRAAEQRRNDSQKRYEELKNDLLEHPHLGKTRLLKAFPDMVHASHNDLVRELEEELEKRKGK